MELPFWLGEGVKYAGKQMRYIPRVRHAMTNVSRDGVSAARRAASGGVTGEGGPTMGGQLVTAGRSLSGRNTPTVQGQREACVAGAFHEGELCETPKERRT